MKSIILDTDIGSDVDDALALVHAMNSPELNLEGVTTVYGNVETRAKIAKKLIDYSGKNIPVHTGESNPISGKTIWHTGREGKGILSEEEQNTSPYEMGIENSAVDFLANKIQDSDHPISLCTIGPLTNIARALEKYPDLENKISHHYLMGGAISFYEPLDIENPVEATYRSHNIFSDTNAAQIVFRSQTPKTIVPADITATVPIRKDELSFLKDGSEVSKNLYNLIEEWITYKGEDTGFFKTRIYVHDPMTIAAITHPELFKTKEFPIEIYASGHTIISEEGTPVNVCYDLDRESFKELFLSRIA